MLTISIIDPRICIYRHIIVYEQYDKAHTMYTQDSVMICYKGLLGKIHFERRATQD